MTETAIEKTPEVTIIQPAEATIELPLPVATDLVVVARNASEMASSREQLGQWPLGKIAEAKAALTTAETELAKVKEMHQRTAAFKSKVDDAAADVVFYEKLHAALAAGYCIVPDFPVQIIAVRTVAEEPASVERKVTWGGSMPAVSPDGAALGEGRYVSPETKNEIEKRPGDKEGSIEKWRVAKGFQKVSFPVKLARMAILENLDRAQKTLIFDSIGILPNTSRPRPDPMLIGRIEHSRSDKSVSFMIALWLDTKTL
jgi:hypothetical protein